MKIPKGSKLVPVEPTKEMLQALDLNLTPLGNFKRMHAAAPTPPACRMCCGDGIAGATIESGKIVRIPCPECSGAGSTDSGGTLPWGEQALMPCPECAPTPPAQEDEPVLWAESDLIRQIASGSIASMTCWGRKYKFCDTALYTHAPSDKLRQAAREISAWKHFGEGNIDTLLTLIADIDDALEGKS